MRKLRRRLFVAIAGLLVFCPLVVAQPLVLPLWDKFVTDQQLQRHGRPSLLWPDISQTTTVYCEEVPKDLTRYATVSFWMHVADPTDSLLTLVFISENPATEGTDYYMATITTKFQGWRHVRLPPLQLLSAVGEPLGWGRINRVFFSSTWNTSPWNNRKPDPKTVVHIQDFTLDPTPIPGSFVLVEAEDFTGQGGGAVEITGTKVGVRGKAFLNWNDAGHWLEWTLTVPRAGRYHLLIRACTAKEKALRKLTVNGKTPGACEAMEFAGTGGWGNAQDHGYRNAQDDWRTFVVTARGNRRLALDLPAGPAAIRLENVDGNPLNLDWLALSPAP